jgi:Zn-finger nucleic acid-binding protein
MPEIATRYPCPVCLGINLDQVKVGSGDVVEIDVCRRCGGVWLDYGEVQRLRGHAAATAWAAIGHPPVKPVTLCHSCHAPLDRALEKCPACGHANLIDCPVCDKPLRRAESAGIQLDVCRTCKGVWFDHDELETIWKVQVGDALQRRSGSRHTGEDVTDAVLASLWYAPHLPYYAVGGMMDAASGLGHAASAVPGLVSSAPEAAVHLVGAAGDAAGGIFDAIAAIIEGILGLFDG